ncbi:MAG: LysM peptidoglycan-binding domain-containing protein [Gammaproteobacteria bacterium]|nr:LysM peptidoglycan-binding domain-containing protein [Gammaproteobacteria bacterium]
MSMNLRSTSFFIGLSVCCSVVSAAQPTPPTGMITRTPSGETQADPFPRPNALAEQVAFWRSVYGYWSLGQVALHDMDYPGIVYEVVDLPGEASEGYSYTAAQKKLIEEHRTALQAQLQAVARHYKTPSLLTDAERELLFRIQSVAGEDAVPGAAERVRSQRGMRERFRRGLEISGRYDATFRRIFSDAGLPTDLAFLPHVESSFQTSARSSAGAVGVWQFTRGAGRLFLKMNAAIDERLDPVASARGAARYLSHAYDTLGNWPYAVTSYNHGIEGMLRAKRLVGDDFAQAVREYESRSFGFASKNFYTEFLAARDVASSPHDYFAGGVRLEAPLDVQKVVLDRKLSAAQLAKLHEVSLKQITELNPAWSRRAARGELPLPVGVEVWLPPAKTAQEQPNSVAVAPLTAPQLDTTPIPPATSRNYHVVRRHDTLFGIAARYGMDVPALQQLNNRAPDNDVVRVGDKLRVVEDARDDAALPATAPEAALAEDNTDIIHIVRKGETPVKIASSYGITVAKLLTSNDLTKQSIIRPGQRFRIPRQ